MKKLKWLLISVLVIVGFMMFVGMPYMQEQTKKHSPQITNTYAKNNFDLKASFSSPSKKGRVIFGELVPFDVVWRTGANEPSTFTTANDIKIIDKTLAAGTYSIWTKPGKDAWGVMFNKEIPDWGVTILSRGKKTTRNPDADVVSVEVPTEGIATVQEKFAIDFEDGEQLYLILSWDQTKVRVPINN